MYSRIPTTPKSIITERNVLTPFIIKLLKTKDKDKNFKAARKNWGNITFKEASVILRAIF